MIDAKNKEIEEFKQELKVIEKSSVNFACFLKYDAITPYNDALLAYMNHLIREEKDKVGRGGSDVTLNSLEAHLQSYKYEIEILNKEMEKGDLNTSAILISEVNKLIDELCKLKHSGKFLVDTLHAVISTRRYVAEYKEVVASERQHVIKDGKKDAWYKFW